MHRKSLPMIRKRSARDTCGDSAHGTRRIIGGGWGAWKNLPVVRILRLGRFSLVPNATMEGSWLVTIGSSSIVRSRAESVAVHDSTGVAYGNDPRYEARPNSIRRGSRDPMDR